MDAVLSGERLHILGIKALLGVTASGRAFRRVAPRVDNLTQYERSNTRFILHLVSAGSFRLSS
ncbi:hypothetical protein C9I78_26015 (plasmid) [Vibrio parahaemolyticus]|nr:hypothetical protein C9I78_26015 [Vibrio parahaemolyticus]AWJ81877.1 hypothetical protein C7Y67_26110 [Vibrio parahaemolyticus]